MGRRCDQPLRGWGAGLEAPPLSTEARLSEGSLKEASELVGVGLEQCGMLTTAGGALAAAAAGGWRLEAGGWRLAGVPLGSKPF